MAKVGLNKQHPLYKEDIERIALNEQMAVIRNKRFLITGATGLLGVFLIDVLMRIDNTMVYAVVRDVAQASKRFEDYLSNPRFQFIQQDATQPLPAGLDVDVIIPLASKTHPLAYSQYPVETILLNVKGAEHALAKAVECDAIVLYPSSVEIYGNAVESHAFVEEDTGKLSLSTSRSCYTESKRLSEALCQSYCAEHDAKVKIVRLSRIFGPTMLMSDSKASSQFLLKALHGEDIVLKSKGEQTFSYTYVADAVSAMLHVLIHGEIGKAYNISSEKCDVRLKDFAQICAEWVGRNVVFELPSDIEQRGYSVASFALLDNSRLKTLGWNSGYTIKDAIERTLEILKADHQLGEPSLLFEKIEDDVIQKQLDKLEATKKANERLRVGEQSSGMAAEHKAEPIKETVSFEDFEKLDIRVGLVKACEKVKKSKKLLQFTIDDGTGTDRTICSGIAAYYDNPEDLVDKRILFVANFAPRKMMGIESQGMILSAVDYDGSLSVVSATKDVKPGSQVG